MLSGYRMFPALVAVCLCVGISGEVRADDQKVMQYRAAMEKCMTEEMASWQRASDISLLVRSRISAEMIAEKWYMPCMDATRNLSNALKAADGRKAVDAVDNEVLESFIAKLLSLKAKP
jgi:hypothetical protein